MAVFSQIPSENDENFVKQLTIVWIDFIHHMMQTEFGAYWPVEDVQMTKGKASHSSDIIVTCQKPEDETTRMALETVINDLDLILKYSN